MTALRIVFLAVLLVLDQVALLASEDTAPPAAWYRFANQAALGKDDSGHGHDALTTAGVSFDDRDPGRPGAAQFDGKARLLLPPLTRGDCTIALWVKTNQSAGAGPWRNGKPLVDGHAPEGAGKDLGLSLLGGHAVFGAGAGDAAAVTSTATLADGAWHHLAATRRDASGELALWIDGRRDKAIDGPPGARSDLAQLVVGAGPAGDGFVGRLDDLRIYARVLDATEIGRLANGESTVTAAPVRDTLSDVWAATDALGRGMPMAEDAPVRPGRRSVGIFYFLWLGNHGPDRIFDITQLLAANPAAPAYGPEGAFHWWGEPHFGHYRSNDEFVIRKHAQMLADAGVDTVFFDVTNSFTYDATILAICRVYRQIRAFGGRTPQISFIAWSNGPATISHLYDTFYAKGLYSELWFRWDGKPLILAPLRTPNTKTPQDLDAKLLDFFAVRQSWAWTKGQGWFGDGKDRWSWIDRWPQNPGWHDSPDKPEEISVTVAGHPVDNLGRSFHDKQEPPPDQRRAAEGACFAEQWKRALEVDPQFVFVTGWNEWVAQRFTKKPGQGAPHMLGRELADGGSFFVDEYDQEFSRDAEPMRDGHGDDFYYQLAENIRRYKGARPLPKPSAPRRMLIGDDFSQWKGVTPEYLDDLGDDRHREHPGFGSSGMLTERSGRNDLDTMKVARDADTLYFYARARAPLTPSTDHQWMLLLLDVDGDHRNGWAGYDFVVDRTIVGNKTTLERCLGGGKFERVAELPFIAKGNELQFAIPRKLLGLEQAKGALTFDFKWADNPGDSGDPIDFIDHGDVAPNGRFNYRFKE